MRCWRILIFPPTSLRLGRIGLEPIILENQIVMPDIEMQQFAAGYPIFAGGLDFVLLIAIGVFAVRYGDLRRW